MNITPLTPQQAFDLAVNGIRAQGYAISAVETTWGLHGKSKTTTCKYRHEGLKCAAGFMIPDELYYTGLEGEPLEGIFDGHGAGQDPAKHAAVLNLLANTQALAMDLQDLHDASVMPRMKPLERAAEFEAGFQRIAREHGLVYKSALDGQPVTVPSATAA